MVDGVARVVLRSDVTTLDFVYPQSDDQAAYDAAAAENRRRVETSTIEDWTPRAFVGEAAEPLLSCGEISAPARVVGLRDAERPHRRPRRAPRSRRLRRRARRRRGRLRVDRAASTWRRRGGTASSSAPRPWTRPRPTSTPSTPATRRTASYVGSGSVVGHLLNQFSMSEHEGVLRVASTTDPTWWERDQSQPGESRVTTLRPRRAAPCSRSASLERPRRRRAHLRRSASSATSATSSPSARSTRCTCSTSSDPASPTQVGELELPGLLRPTCTPSAPRGCSASASRPTPTATALGRAALAVRRRRPDRPDAAAARRSLPGLYTEVEFDHRAFLWWAPTAQAVIPARLVPTGDDGTPPASPSPTAGSTRWAGPPTPTTST